MKYAIISLLSLSSCQQGITGYEGELFIPQAFTTSCMQEGSDRLAEESERDFRLLSNGTIMRENPEGKNYTFKMVSSASMQSDDLGFCILWLAYDIYAQEALTVFLYENSITFDYDNGETCRYFVGCSEDDRLDEITLNR